MVTWAMARFFSVSLCQMCLYVYCNFWSYCSVLQCDAGCGSVLHCNLRVCGSVLQCVAVCCSVLQCAVLQSSGVLQCVAVCCSLLQFVACSSLLIFVSFHTCTER